MTDIMLPSAFVYFPSEGTMPCKLQPRATAANQSWVYPDQMPGKVTHVFSLYFKALTISIAGSLKTF